MASSAGLATPRPRFPRSLAGAAAVLPADLAGADGSRGEVLVPAVLRFCSCLRRCSERGLLPALDARIASAGSLMSGFCGAGSWGLGGGVGCCTFGMGARLMAGPVRSGLSIFFFSSLFSVVFSVTSAAWAPASTGSGGFSLDGSIFSGFLVSTGTFLGPVPAGAT